MTLSISRPSPHFPVHVKQQGATMIVLMARLRGFGVTVQLHQRSQIVKLKYIAANILTCSVATLAAVVSYSAFAQSAGGSVRRGEGLVSTHCAMCHAIGRSGTSPHPMAPPFRTLLRRYPAESLVESLSEGLTSGHPEMPTFVFSPSDTGAILLYLQSIQE
jgi:mono/diheme cytochrome c family protein